MIGLTAGIFILLITIMSRDEKWKKPEGTKLIYIGKDMKLPVGQKRMNLEGRRRE